MWVKPYRLSHVGVHHGRTLEEFDDASLDLVKEQLFPVDGSRNGRVVLVQWWIVFVLLSVKVAEQWQYLIFPEN